MKSLILLVCVFGFSYLVNGANSSNTLRKLLQSSGNRLYYFNRCNNQEKEWMTQCEIDAADDWDIAQSQNDLSSRSYCCYVWDVLRCKLRTAENCDPYFADQLERDTESQYNSVCYYHSRYSGSCALRWWMIMLIVIGGLIIIALISFCIWRSYRNKYSSKYDY